MTKIAPILNSPSTQSHESTAFMTKTAPGPRFAKPPHKEMPSSVLIVEYLVIPLRNVIRFMNIHLVLSSLERDQCHVQLQGTDFSVPHSHALQLSNSPQLGNS
jgi:hypothetical protein